MKKSVKSNMYTNTLDSVWELFGSYLYGQNTGLIVVISSHRLNQQALSALQSSFAQLGYGKEACTFMILEGSSTLSDKNLLAAIEGLDPLFLIITDSKAVRTCSEAYRQSIELDGRTCVFGREVRAFHSFESMLADPLGKQKAWGLLKTIPKLDS